MQKDLGRARVWYQRAAEHGNVKAMHNLAVLSAGGEGGGPDYAGATAWFIKAAEHGLPDSQYNLAVLFENGLGVKQDTKTAYKWYALAARGGDKDAIVRRDAVKAALSPADLKTAEALVSSFAPKPADPLANDARAAERTGRSAPIRTATAEARTWKALADRDIPERDPEGAVRPPRGRSLAQRSGQGRRHRALKAEGISNRSRPPRHKRRSCIFICLSPRCQRTCSCSWPWVAPSDFYPACSVSGGGFLLTPLLMFSGIPAAVAVGTGMAQIVASSVSGAVTSVPPQQCRYQTWHRTAFEAAWSALSSA